MRLRSVGLLAVLALVFVSCRGGEPQASGPGEGIQVHGDWTVQIHNEDGSLDRQFEFGNALMDYGAESIARVLARETLPGEWVIVLDGLPVGPCETSLGLVAPCEISERSGQFPNLEVEAGFTGRITLTGTAVVQNATTITWVATAFDTCAPGVGDCLADGSGASWPSEGFSGKSSDDDPNDGFEPAAVEPGQEVQVSVEISFVSG